MVLQLSHGTGTSEYMGFSHVLPVCDLRHIMGRDSGYVALWSQLLCLQQDNSVAKIKRCPEVDVQLWWVNCSLEGPFLLP